MRCIEENEENNEFRESKGSRMLRIMALVPFEQVVIPASASSSMSFPRLALVISIYFLSSPRKIISKLCQHSHSAASPADTPTMSTSRGTLLPRMAASYRCIDQYSRFLATLHSTHSSPNGGPAFKPLAPHTRHSSILQGTWNIRIYDKPSGHMTIA
jgi:hypothetical protein